MGNINYPVVLGWYIGASAKKATYDPGLVPCPFCGIKTTDDNVRTLNLVAADRDPMLSVFYRCHRTCHDDAGRQGQQSLDNFVMDALETMREKKSDE